MEIGFEINEKYDFQISSKFLCFLFLPKAYHFLQHNGNKGGLFGKLAERRSGISPRSLPALVLAIYHIQALTSLQKLSQFSFSYTL